MKIPTLVGIALLITLIVSIGLFIYYRSEKKTAAFQISDVEVVNIGNTTVTVVWQTATPTVGEILYSADESLSEKAVDNRDRRQIRPRLIHFVTINNLKQNTRYFYKVKNDLELSPKALDFKTGNAAAADDELSFSFIKPIKGTVLNTNLNPIDESLVFLKIPGAAKLATFSSTAGNFILPLKTVLSENLNQIYVIAPDSPAELSILKGQLRSTIKIVISEDTVNLPPIAIGSNLDLTNFKPQPLTSIIFGGTRAGSLDFNGDGRTNSLDLAQLREIAKPDGLKGTDASRYDVNGDGEVNQQDVDEFSKSIIAP